MKQDMIFRGVTKTMSAFALPVMSAAQPALASEGFTHFAGYWRGSGSVLISDGSREVIRCKAVYAVRPDGDAINADMNCASDSYKVHMTTQVASDGRVFTGAWQEATRQAQGTVTGRISSSSDMAASLQAVGIAMQLTARADGARQAISLRTQGGDVRDVSIDLHR